MRYELVQTLLNPGNETNFFVVCREGIHNVLMELFFIQRTKIKVRLKKNVKKYKRDWFTQSTNHKNIFQFNRTTVFSPSFKMPMKIE